MSATVFTIANQKGGVGKTTVSRETAFYLAQQGKKTLLYDGDIRKGVLHDYFRKKISPSIVNNCAREDSEGMISKLPSEMW